MKEPTLPPDMNNTLIDIDWKAKRFRVGRCGVAVLVAVVLGVTGKLFWVLPLVAPAAIMMILGKGR